MRCFSGGRQSSRARGRATPSASPPHLPSSPPPPPRPPAAARSTASEIEEEDDGGDWRQTRRRDESPTSSTATSPASTINLTREYALAVQTNSYNEIWTKIFGGSAQEVSTSANLIAGVLQPDRASIQEALSAARPTRLTTLASRYFDSSELTSHLCLSLHRAVERARALYAPVAEVLDLLPHPLRISAPQCDWAFDRLSEFHRHDNPFPAPAAFEAFCAMRDCFVDLRPQLDLRLLHARRRHRLLRHVTHASAACLVASVAGLAVAAIVLATHAIAALVAGPALLLGLPPPSMRDLLTRPRQRLRERMAHLDAATRGAYVLNGDLDTIEHLVVQLHAVVESDRALVGLGLERGRGHHHLIEEVLRHLRSSHSSFLHQLRDLDEHVCLCFAALNRARSLLLHHIYHTASHAAPHEQQHQELADTTT